MFSVGNPMTVGEKAYKAKLKALIQFVWRKDLTWDDVIIWLNNFEDNPGARINMLHLLANFLYFGQREVAELLRSLYRDKYRYPVIENIRALNGYTLDKKFIEDNFIQHQKSTRFIGIGNPAESGQHLLYYYRQYSDLPKDLFINAHEILSLNKDEGVFELADPAVTHYIFIDDLCGSGQQAVEYSQKFVEEIKALNPDATIEYHMLFGLAEGIENVKENTAFDSVEAVFELDDSFRCFSDNSRYYIRDIPGEPPGLDKEVARSVASLYGERLLPNHGLGYRGSQLLIGFNHNTPDNTLPIIWSEGSALVPWTPIFPRFQKVE